MSRYRIIMLALAGASILLLLCIGALIAIGNNINDKYETPDRYTAESR